MPATKKDFLALRIAVLLGILYFGAKVLIPVLLAFFLFLFLEPAIEISGKYLKLPLKGTAALFVILAMASMGLVGWASYQSVVRVAVRLPNYSQKIQQFTSRLHVKAKSLQKSADFLLPPNPEPVQKVELVESRALVLPSYLADRMNSLVDLFSMFFFVPLITFFMLIERKSLARRLKEVVPDEELLHQICSEVRSVSRGFFSGSILLATTMTVIFAVVFRALGLESSLEFALIAGFLNLIPVFGAVAGAALPMVQAFLQFDGVGPAVLIGIASVVIHILANNVVLPKVVGSRVNVNGTAAVIGFLVWGALWGTIGIFLAVPLMGILRVCLLASVDYRPYANLISRNPVREWGRPRFVPETSNPIPLRYRQ